jgi:glycosyltransferase involved in cell wall biosynthesis
MADAGFAAAEGSCGGWCGVTISVIIPALNEAESIGAVVRAIPRETRPWGEITECIVVDNGSTDATAETAREAGARVIAAPRGYGAAMCAGVRAAVGEVLVFVDGDGADPVEEMPRIVGPVERGEADLVLASRMLGKREKGSMQASQVFAGHLIGWMVRVLYGFRYSDMCAFRAIRRETVEQMQMREMTFGWNLEMQIKAVKMGLRIREVPVDYRRRIGGESKVSGNLAASVKAAWRILGVFVKVRRTGIRD